MNKIGGFTLVEVLASIVLLVILGVVFFEFFVASQDTAANNEGKLDAVMIAQSVLEDIKNGKYPEITSDCGKASYPKVFQNRSSTANRACDMSVVKDKADCQARYEKRNNNDRYYVEIEVGSELESGLGLHPVEVKVFDRAGKMRSSLRGAVKICAGAS